MIRDFGRSRLAVLFGSVHLAAAGLLMAASQEEDVGAWLLLDLPAFVLTALALASAQNAFLAHEVGDWPWTVLLLVLGTLQWWCVGVAWAAGRRALRKTTLDHSSP